MEQHRPEGRKGQKDAKIKEFLGIREIDSNNKNLDNAMEVKGEDVTSVKNIIDKRVDKKYPKQKPKRKKRNFFFG